MPCISHVSLVLLFETIGGQQPPQCQAFVVKIASSPTPIREKVVLEDQMRRVGGAG